MFNLKTDDILGARPRIRHAPRNLIRDQKLSQQNNDSYGNAPYNTDSYYHQYPYSKNDNQNHQAYLNYQQGIRASQYMSNEPKYVQDVKMSQSFVNSPAGKSSDNIHNNINYIDRYDQAIGNRASQRLFIKPKDAPVVNYDKYTNLPESQRTNIATTYTRAYNGLNKDLYEKYNYQNKGNKIESVQLNRSRQEQKSYEMAKPEKQKPRSRSSMNTSKDSSSSVQKSYQGPVKQQEQERGKNIFRGLGFNIITNSKFEYGMENRFNNNKSKWLD